MVYGDILYNFIKYNPKSKTSRWTCSYCRCAGLTTKGDFIENKPERNLKYFIITISLYYLFINLFYIGEHTKSCPIMLKSEIKIKIAYETLKFNSRKKEFSFAKEYQATTTKLREKFHVTMVLYMILKKFLI